MLSYLTKLYQLGSLPVIRPGATQVLAFGAVSAASAPTGAGVVRLLATADCHVAIGGNPVANSSSLLLPANTPEYFACNTSDAVGAIQDSAAGTLYITPAV